jgi:hypothetical protein
MLHAYRHQSVCAKLDIAAVRHEKKPSQCHAANGILGGTPHPEGSLSSTDLGRSPIGIWVLISNILPLLILGHDILHTNDASADLRCQALPLGSREEPLWGLGHDHTHPPIGREAARWQQLEVVESEPYC